MKHEKIDLPPSEVLTKVIALLASTKKGHRMIFDLGTCELFVSRKHFVVKTRLFTGSSDSNRMPIPVVVKYFNPGIADHTQRWQNEVKNTTELSSQFAAKKNKALRIPKLIVSVPGVIVYEYIPGTILEDSLRKGLLPSNGIGLFCEWLYRIHSCGLTFGDQRLRNFLWLSQESKSDPVLYGVDLEDIRPGSPKDIIEDVALFCSAFIDFRLENLLRDPDPVFIEPVFGQSTAYMVDFLSYYVQHLPKALEHTLGGFALRDPKFWTGEIVAGLQKIIERREIHSDRNQLSRLEKILFALLKF